MTEARLRQLVGDIAQSDRTLRWGRGANKAVESMLLALGRAILAETAPLETGKRRRVYGQILSFRMECPACGSLIAPTRSKKKAITYDLANQLVICPNPECLTRWTIGILIWPRVKGRLYHQPIDTRLPLEYVPELRRRADAVVASEPYRQGKPVNVLEEEEDRGHN